MENKGVKIWLVKVPLFFAEKILSLEKTTVLGNLVISKATSTEAAVFDLKLADEFCAKGFPSSFNVNVIARKDNMCVVKTNINGIHVEGMVSNECYITPEINEEYFHISVVWNRRMVWRKVLFKLLIILGKEREGRSFGVFGSWSILLENGKNAIR